MQRPALVYVLVQSTGRHGLNLPRYTGRGRR
jgi:hypothetical protein